MSLALEAFLQLVNNIGFKKQLLVAKVDTIEWALGDAFFQANSAYQPGVKVRQVKADDGLPLSKLASVVYLLKSASAADKADSTRSLVRQLLAKIRHQLKK